jgi:hypothetical protein
MDKDEPELCLAAFQGRFEPVVLRFAQGPAPVVVQIRRLGLYAGVPEGIEDDKKGVAPGPGVVTVTHSPKDRIGRRRPGIELAWDGVWVIKLA